MTQHTTYRSHGVTLPPRDNFAHSAFEEIASIGIFIFNFNLQQWHLETETKNTKYTAAIASKAVWAKLPREGKVTPFDGT